MPCAQCNAPMAADARFCGACGAAAKGTENAGGGDYGDPDQDVIGREIAGRYRILAKLGEGGMGAVFRAEQISLKRTVALKLLKPELSRDQGLVRRFNAEAELAAKLKHPSTVTLYDYGQDGDGTLFIAMELVEGQSLRAVLSREGALSATRTLAICEQVAASLADAHAHGIVHRDLKPDNIMLSERGRQTDVVTVLDFGIAKLRDDRGDMTAMPLTRAGDLLGTPQYMAPEQIRGETVDGRTDVYALGAVMYEMVTGRLPFEAPSLMGMLSMHLQNMPAPPREKRPDLAIPEPLEAMIMAALRKPPDERPGSMEQLGEQIEALRGTLDGAGVPHQAGSPYATPPGHANPYYAPPPIAPAAGRPPGVPLSGHSAEFPAPDASESATPGVRLPHGFPPGVPVPTPAVGNPAVAAEVFVPTYPANAQPAAPTPTPVGQGPATGPGPAPGQGGTTRAGPGSGKSKLGWWIALAVGVVAVGAAGVIAIVKANDDNNKAHASTDTDTPAHDVSPDDPDEPGTPDDPDDPVTPREPDDRDVVPPSPPGPGPRLGELLEQLPSIDGDGDSGDSGDNGGDDEVAALLGEGGGERDSSGVSYRNRTFGYALDLPAGFSEVATGNPAMAGFQGTVRGQPSVIIVAAAPSSELGGTDDQTLGLLVAAMAAQSGGELVRTDHRTIKGKRRPSGLIDESASKIRFEYVIYVSDDTFVVAMFGAPKATFSRTSRFRDQLFGRRLSLPR